MERDSTYGIAMPMVVVVGLARVCGLFSNYVLYIGILIGLMNLTDGTARSPGQSSDRIRDWIGMRNSKHAPYTMQI